MGAVMPPTSCPPAPYRVVGVTLVRRRRLSPSFVRLTFAGPGVEHVADHGLDQRVKLVLPLPGGETGLLPGSEPWFDAWRALPQDRRNPLRTYTLRAVRARDYEVDVDLVLHDGHGGGVGMPGAGPAARWAGSVREGDLLSLVLPDSRHPGPSGGIDFCPPPGTDRLLLVADESALPAVAGILERLPATARGEVVVEVPHAGDVLPLEGPPGMPVTYLARGAAPRGSLVAPAVHAAAARVASPTTYAWMAGEAGVVTRLRRRLVTHDGWDRGRVTFRGYWREGVAEG